jgi:Zn-dependent protease
LIYHDSTGQLNTAPLSAGLVRVLFVRVSVVARPTRVSVEVGKVIVPVLVIVLIVGEDSVRPDTDVVVAPKDRAVEPRVVVPVALVLALVIVDLS